MALTGSSVIANLMFGYWCAYFLTVSPSRKPAAMMRFEFAWTALL